jgi:UDP-glucoronosyl and UDP-glucosyl transferase
LKPVDSVANNPVISDESNDIAHYGIEYIIRHQGTPHLRNLAHQMPLYQTGLLDAVSISIVFLFARMDLIVRCLP